MFFSHWISSIFFFIHCGPLIKIDFLKVISNYWHFLHSYLAAVAFYQFNFCFQLIQYYPIASKWKWFLLKTKTKNTPNCCRILFQIDCVRCPTYNVGRKIKPLSLSLYRFHLWYAFDWSSVLEIKSKLPRTHTFAFISLPGSLFRIKLLLPVFCLTLLLFPSFLQSIAFELALCSSALGMKTV